MGTTRLSNTFMGTRRINTVIEIEMNNGRKDWAEWAKEYGTATTQNIQKYMDDFVASCKPGGCNEHLGLTEIPYRATVKKQGKNGVHEILAEWKAPMFWAI
jgi:hypothetical protein